MDLQQRLEEDVKKDQKEKKTNQDLLKALKLEVDQVLEQQRRLGGARALLIFIFEFVLPCP